MSDLVGNPEERFSSVAAHVCLLFPFTLSRFSHDRAHLTKEGDRASLSHTADDFVSNVKFYESSYCLIQMAARMT